MRKYLLIDAISNINGNIITEYFIAKSKMQKRPKNTTSFINQKKVWMALVACFLIMFASIITIFIMKQKNAGNLQIPDKSHNFYLGEKCENNNWSGTYHSIVFTNVYLTEDILGQNGYFIVFKGTIQSAAFSFPTKNHNFDIWAETNHKQSNQLIKSFYFEENLSKQLSKANLALDGQNGEMSGDFCLVFLIDKNDFCSLWDKKEHMPADDVPELYIVLDVGINWAGGRSLFYFKNVELEYIKKL